MQHESDAALLAELQAINKPDRLAYIAAQPAERLVRFKRLLSREDVKKLNAHIDRTLAEARKPSVTNWLAAARAGKATSPDAMIAVLKEVSGKLRPNDAQWIDRIESSAAGRSYSSKQAAVIQGIYQRYFGPQAGS